ncbi:MAG: DUF928 domain-containing protein [Scytolyngbya sp. HA4215-MV1]|jgi:hypothetical protein|nr:DUF928 domain-containing protein [Scytolyngbya sp. HA4215-MV1]
MWFSKSWKGISIVLLLGAIVAVDLAEFATAVLSQPSLIARSARRRRLSFRVGVRPSHRRVGGYSRAALSCTKNDEKQLMALIPPPQTQETSFQNEDRLAVIDKTVTDRPTFFFYVPILPVTTAQFTLQDELGNTQLYSVKFKLKGKPGIVGVVLPSSVPALKVGQKYLWQVSIACNSDDQTDQNIVLGSWIERVKVSTSAGSERLVALAEQGIWQDVVTPLAIQRYRQPNDANAAADWTTLMNDAGLPQFKQTPIVQIIQ